MLHCAVDLVAVVEDGDGDGDGDGEWIRGSPGPSSPLLCLFLLLLVSRTLSISLVPCSREDGLGWVGDEVELSCKLCCVGAWEES